MIRDYNFFLSKLSWTYGRAIDSDGVVRDYDGFAISGLVNVRNAIKLTFAKLSRNGGAFYDSQYNFLKAISPAIDGENITLSVPDDAYYARFNYSVNEIKSLSVSIKDFHDVNLAERVQAFPLWKEDLSINYSHEDEQQYMRGSLSGKLTFVSYDYNCIRNTDIEQPLYLNIEVAQTGDILFTGKFAKTDCTFDDDNMIVEVQPDVYDGYNALLAGIEKEYDVVKEAVAQKSITIHKRALIQVYMRGESIINGYIGGSSWEQDCTAVDSSVDLQTKYYFSLANMLVRIELTAKSTGDDYPYPTAPGVYCGKMALIETPSTDGVYRVMRGRLEQADATSLYYILITQEMQENEPTGKVMIQVVRKSDNTVSFEYVRSSTGMLDSLDFIMVDSTTLWTIQASLIAKGIYARYLCDVDKVGDLNAYNIPSDDMVSNNLNYRKVLPYAIDCTDISSRTSTNPTRWGVYQNTIYYLPPYNILGDIYVPLNQSIWSDVSYWFRYNELDWNFDDKAAKDYTLKQAYTIGGVIKMLLKKIAPEVEFEETSEYSQFLYGNVNPKLPVQLFITPKSNITAGEYSDPAQKGPISLQTIFNMLKNLFKCYWAIDGNKLIIEHINYFRNGGQYNIGKGVGIDLTKLTNTRNGKKWDYGKNSWSYNKSDMAQQYKFAWMDDVTDAFAGEPIEIVSNYVQDGRIEDINISNFTSDIDYMMFAPDEFSSDGFALIGAVKDSTGNYSIAISSVSMNGISYRLQNGYLSLAYLLPTFWIYDMPAKSLMINNESKTAVSVEKNKKQTVNIPDAVGADLTELVKTGLGDGTIDDFSLTLSSKMAKVTLVYATE